jgi:hypothetical protein
VCPGGPGQKRRTENCAAVAASSVVCWPLASRHTYYVTNRGRVRIVGSEPTRDPTQGSQTYFPAASLRSGVVSSCSVSTGWWTLYGRAGKPCTEFTDDFRPAGSQQVSRLGSSSSVEAGARHSVTSEHRIASHRTAPAAKGGGARPRTMLLHSWRWDWGVTASCTTYCTDPVSQLRPT